MIRQTYRFALAPTGIQETFLAMCLGASRFWFNQGLALVIQRLNARRRGEQVRLPWSYRALCSELNAKLRAELAPWQAEVVSGCYLAGFEALGRALQNFSKARRKGRRARFPRFRRKGGRHAESVIFQRPRILDVRYVEFDRRIGPVRTRERMSKLTRLLDRDPQARILRSTVTRRSERWFVSFTVERSRKQRRARRPEAVAGIDLGLRRLATVSTGEWFRNGRPLQVALRRLCRLQRQLDRQRRATNPANLRREQAHQLTTALTREFGVLGVETLAVKNMLRQRHLSRAIADAGWGEILRQLAYKTAWSEGSRLVRADRFYPSSKICHACGRARATLARGETTFTCDQPRCGWSCDRDLNAALNLAHMAYECMRAEGQHRFQVARTERETKNARRGKVSPVHESGPSPMKREGSEESPRSREGLAVAAQLQGTATGG